MQELGLIVCGFEITVLCSECMSESRLQDVDAWTCLVSGSGVQGFEA